MKRSIHTPDAPPGPLLSGQAVAARGEMVFVSAQAAQTAEGRPIRHLTFEAALDRAMDNVAVIAKAAGCTLRDHCVKATFFLAGDPDHAALDRVCTHHFGAVLPSISIIHCNATRGPVEVEAILVR